MPHLSHHNRQPAAESQQPRGIDQHSEQLESTHGEMEARTFIMHAHVSNEDETPSSDPEQFGRLPEGLRKHRPGLIVQFSTGGWFERKHGGRLSLRPNMASLAERRLGPTRRRALREVRAARHDAGRGVQDRRPRTGLIVGTE